MVKTKDKFLGILIQELVDLMKKQKEATERFKQHKTAAATLMDSSKTNYHGEIDQTKRIIELYLGDQYIEKEIQELIIAELL
ncbi:hypothetical protein EI200_04500 [Peribacillus simplex]|uniref:hypothetical protein n=1 Tax=Peribacillus simplex TaxID=1478 RepID=UPI000F641C9D|nr:hypothetical protein [Peribacillus simplex]RRN73945.1 hypothetical protein EI200_04500 [Peribacillus simplex]